MTTGNPVAGVAPHEMYIRRKTIIPELPPMPVVGAVPEKIPELAPQQVTGMPSPKQQQWGVVVSIVIIMLMIIIGAFYAWGERIAQNQAYPVSATAGQ